jgi:predicted N-acetyltransferase YhbS
MVTIGQERAREAEAREELLDRVFGEERFHKTCEELRRGRLPAAGLSLVARSRGKLVGTVRLWDIIAGTAGPAVLLGPLAVAPELQGRGVGSRLARHAIHEAGLSGHRAVLLVGDGPFYARFGFATDYVSGLELPGPVERSRFHGLELTPGALQGARGLVVAAGQTVVAPRHLHAYPVGTAARLDSPRLG